MTEPYNSLSMSLSLAAGILTQLTDMIDTGFNTLQLQRTPHLALVSKNFYE
jgi:hypothetical protein